MALEKKYFIKSDVPILTKDELINEVTKAQNGDQEALRNIIESNQKFVYKIIRKYFGVHYIDNEDLIQEANIGLINAVEKFDVSTDFSFLTYAGISIERTVKRFLENNSSSIRIPNRAYKDRWKIEEFVREYKNNNFGMRPNDEEIVAATGLTLDKIKTMKNIKSVSSLEAEVDTHNEEEGSSLIDFLDSGINIESDYLVKENYEYLSSLINDVLDDREIDIIKRRFGFMGEPETLDYIGEYYGLSKERVRQIENTALRILKNAYGNKNRTLNLKQKKEKRMKRISETKKTRA